MAPPRLARGEPNLRATPRRRSGDGIRCTRETTDPGSRQAQTKDVLERRTTPPWPSGASLGYFVALGERRADATGFPSESMKDIELQFLDMRSNWKKCNLDVRLPDPNEHCKSLHPRIPNRGRQAMRATKSANPKTFASGYKTVLSGKPCQTSFC